jgi:hypothetical protein
MLQSIVGDFGQLMLHVAGVQRLVELRGGLDSITSLPLRETLSWYGSLASFLACYSLIYHHFRVEMRGIFSQDAPPHFPIPPSWLETYDRKLQNRFSTPASELLVELLEQRAPSISTWSGIYRDLFHFSQTTHIESVQSNGRSWIESLDVGGWTNVLVLRLLKWRPLQAVPDNDAIIAEYLRLGSLLYLAPIWRQYGVSPMRTTLLVQKLVVLREKYSADWTDFWLLEAWVLVIGAMESSFSEQQYLVEELCNLAREQSLTATELLWQTKNVLWIQDAFEKAEFVLHGELEFESKQ